MGRRVTLYRGIRAKAEQRDEIVRAHMQGELGPYAVSGSVYLFHRLPGNERTRLVQLENLTLEMTRPRDTPATGWIFASGDLLGAARRRRCPSSLSSRLISMLWSLMGGTASIRFPTGSIFPPYAPRFCPSMALLASGSLNRRRAAVRAKPPRALTWHARTKPWCGITLPIMKSWRDAMAPFFDRRSCCVPPKPHL